MKTSLVITQSLEQPPSYPKLLAPATRDEKAGEVILKEVEVKLDGVRNVSGPAQAIVLTSDKPEDENTLDAPTKVSPKTTTVAINGSTLRHSFPGNSFTVLRVKTR